MPSIITYDGLPVRSGGAHNLRTRQPTVAWKQASSFLAICTDTSKPTTAWVEVIQGESFPKEFSISLISKISEKLGQSSPRHVGSKDISHRWPIKPESIGEFVSMIEEVESLPTSPSGLQPFVVATQSTFRLLNPETGLVFAGQDPMLYGWFSPSPGHTLGISDLYARISVRSTFSLFLCFAFEEQSGAFQSASAHVQANLPFALSQKRWKHWQPTKKGNSYRGRRITVMI